MRRYLYPMMLVMGVATIAFAAGLYSGVRKNVAFDTIVKTVRYVTPIKQETDLPQVTLDLTDRGLLDSTLLPLHQYEVTVTSPDGKPLPLISISADGTGGAIILADDGSLFQLTKGACTEESCLRPIGRLVRPDGSVLNDNYDILRVESGGAAEWYISYGQESRTGFHKSLVISRFTLPPARSAPAVQRVEQPFFATRPFSLNTGHAPRSGGGELVYDSQYDSLIVTVGDYSLNGISNVYEGDTPPSQSSDSDLGKVLRVDRATGQSSIISMGHRNPQGLSLSADGELILTEHAAKGGDEINLIEQGNNYGWPNVSMGAAYGTYSFPQKPLEAGKVHGGYTPPVVAFLPSPGIGSVMHVEGFHPAWDGDLIAATLKARSLIRLRRWDTGNYAEQIYIGDRIRDLANVGEMLVLATDSGKVIQLHPVENAETAMTATGLNTNLNTLSNCGSCHNLNYPVSTPSAPHLRNVLGRGIASVSDYTAYSPAMQKKAGQDWDAESLEQFLRSPQDFAPGTSMPDPELSDADISSLMEQLPLLR